MAEVRTVACHILLNLSASSEIGVFNQISVNSICRSMKLYANPPELTTGLMRLCLALLGKGERILNEFAKSPIVKFVIDHFRMAEDELGGKGQEAMFLELLRVLGALAQSD